MSDALEWHVKVGRRKVKGSEYPIVQLPAEFRHWIGKTLRLVYDGKQLILTPAEEKKREESENGLNNR